MKKKNLPSFEEIKHLIGNIISIDEYKIDIEDNIYITKTMYTYFLSACNYIIESRSTREYKAILGANINYEPSIPEKMKHSFISEKAKHVFELQMRITNAINKNKLEGPELVMFSSILKGQGSLLMNRFYKDLKSMGYNKFFLFTDSKCNYKWYINNGFKLEKVIPIKIDDLKTIKNHLHEYNVMLFSKEI